jgi:Glutathione-dependent formaldehyde-activating enzyme
MVAPCRGRDARATNRRGGGMFTKDILFGMKPTDPGGSPYDGVRPDEPVPGTFALKSGTPKIYIKTAESGNKRAHAFCPECGAPIYSAAPEPNPSTVGLRVGGIDQRAQFEPPTRQGWCRSALPWSMDLTRVERVDRQF